MQATSGLLILTLRRHSLTQSEVGGGDAWDCGKVENEGEVLNNLHHLFAFYFIFTDTFFSRR